ncbi:MAG: hypothetical protein FJZ00_14320, partial [Candidatus Sericytochromatia bacterium]|nr:hypothetical protein [Candidatus Tanganyikabacteria bacterium]
MRRLAAWLEERDAGRAFDLWLAEDRPDEATALIARESSRMPPSADRDRSVAAWLGKLVAASPAGDPRRDLIAGTLQLRRGEHADAADSLRRGREGFAARGDGSGEFACLARLLAVALQREDFLAGRDAADAAEALESTADAQERVVFRINRGNLEFLGGQEGRALEQYRRALDFPHLGHARIALAQQDACINLAVLECERGSFDAARRALTRALALHADHSVDPSLPMRAYLQRALTAVPQGEFAAATDDLAAAQACAFPAHPYQRAFCLRVMGEIQTRLGRYAEAEGTLRQALDGLAMQGLERSGESAGAHLACADLARRRGDTAGSLARLDEAERLTGLFPRVGAAIALCRGLAIGDGPAAASALDHAASTLAGVAGRHLEAQIALCRAVVAARMGDRAVADRCAGDAARLIREGGYFFLPIAEPALAHGAWSALESAGHGDILAATAARFPRRVPVPVAISPRVEIRTFGPFLLQVGGQA